MTCTILRSSMPRSSAAMPPHCLPACGLSVGRGLDPGGKVLADVALIPSSASRTRIGHGRPDH